MKKICLLLVIILLVLSFAGCNKTYYWQFDRGFEEIVEIKIVDMSKLGLEYCSTIDDFHVIKEIDLKFVEDLCADISSIPYHFFPSMPDPWGKCFLIVFNNGEFDLISADGPTRVRYEDGKLTFIRTEIWYGNDANEFEQLINKYLNS